MEIILRTAAIYVFLLVLFRLTGKRTLSELTTFDFILLLILSEATQNALVDEDRSVVMAMTVILTFVTIDLGLSAIKTRSRTIERITEGVPVVLVNQGQVLEDVLKKTNVTRSDIMAAARLSQGLENMEQIKYAVLEVTGGISIVPAEPDIEKMLDQRIEAALRRLQQRQDGHSEP
ncbi:uncharacterized protein DUF421 [Paucimonas lemoignei]|uniref:Uncharacterized protein DUF421 n=1 Tax=Paucimonas lemoignei TaxID=29443 RepID=A0A4R3HQX6_PAULE|nr:YetF domain-containing protein [Paucimonas lemoignei]TCS35175.1 uncharacterized protein DUF421 [Paucimonas lemoignei]